MRKVLRTAAFFAPVLLVLTAQAMAQTTSSCGGFNTSDSDTASVGILNWITGVPFKIGAAVAMVAAAAVLIFDGGNLPQLAKQIIFGLLIVFATLFVVAFLVSKASCGTYTAGS